MKSERYEILPRIRKMSWSSIEKPVYLCTWKDPGSLVQKKGEPLRYIWTLMGFGSTPDEAIADCRARYIRYKEFSDRFKGRATILVEAPAHCIDTSKLTWWRRLFRV